MSARLPQSAPFVKRQKVKSPRRDGTLKETIGFAGAGALATFVKYGFGIHFPARRPCFHQTQLPHRVQKLYSDVHVPTSEAELLCPRILLHRSSRPMAA